MSNFDNSGRDAHGRLAAMYDECAPRVYAYALRHCGSAHADDVMAETFAIAWRRLDEVPTPPLGWLIGTARRVLAGRRRAERKQVALIRLAETRLFAEKSLPVPTPDEIVIERRQMLNALDSLTHREREALLLVAWDGLSTADAAAVTRCSERAFRARLSRARTRLSQAVHHDEVDRDTPITEKGKIYANRPTSA
ncbi:MAG: RNA polymerase sigma factor [Dermatophilaceae bacterium]